MLCSGLIMQLWERMVRDQKAIFVYEINESVNSETLGLIQNLSEAIKGRRFSRLIQGFYDMLYNATDIALHNAEYFWFILQMSATD